MSALCIYKLNTRTYTYASSLQLFSSDFTTAVRCTLPQIGYSVSRAVVINRIDCKRTIDSLLTLFKYTQLAFIGTSI